MLRPTDRHDCPNCKDDGRPHRHRMRPVPVGGLRATTPPSILFAWECACGSHLPAEPLVVRIDEQAARMATLLNGGHPPVGMQLLYAAAALTVAPFREG